MTTKQFGALKPGTRVRWRDSSTGCLDPAIGTVMAPGETLLATGQPSLLGFVRWEDGQDTLASDAPSVESVEVEE